MEVLTHVEAMRAWSRDARRHGRRIGFVPTMGYLHDGHLALVRAVADHADVVALSIYVNPLQFGPQEDYLRYPRDLDRDLGLAEAAGVAAVFYPSDTEMYPVSPAVYVDVPRLAADLEGRVRPTHFRGVATIVAKLLLAVEPDIVAFGQKDAQQAIIVKRMVRELLFPVTVVVVPTVREPDGLALSSRNTYLSRAERRAAPVLWRALQAARARLEAGERRAALVEATMRSVLGENPLVRVDYARVASLDELAPVDPVAGRVLVAVAARVGATRLIDNVCLEVGPHDVRDTLP
jgi:pantoate--beta-alanine ligase